MNKRKLIISGIGVGILVLSILGSRFLKKPAEPKNQAKVTFATAVNTQEHTPGLVVRNISITGRLVPKRTVNIFAEVGGIAQFGAKPFKPGVRFNAGELMLRINSDEIESNLSAARSGFQSQLASALPDIKLDFPAVLPAWEKYLYSIDLDKRLPTMPEIKDQKLKLFMSGRNILTTYYNIREAETRLQKHIITAPFSGTLTSAQIDASSLVRTGQALGTLISTGDYELQAGVSYADVAAIGLGSSIEMRDVNTGNTYSAKVVRINDAVNTETQQVEIFAEVKSAKAKSGIYLEGSAPVRSYENAIQVPIAALVSENQIFIVKDSAAVLLPVEVLYKDSEKAIISGIQDKVQIITDTHNEAFAGSKVSVVNLKP